MSDNRLTVWQAMSGRNRDLMAAKPVLPAFIALIYGAYRFFDLGTSGDHYLYTYLPVIGAVASIISILIYSSVVKRDKKNIFAMLGAASGFLPYAFSLYLMGFLGIYSIWQSINPFSFWGIVVGLIWVVLGYKLLRKFWIITELAWLPVSEKNLAEILISKLGMKPKELVLLLSDSQIDAPLRGHPREE